MALSVSLRLKRPVAAAPFQKVCPPLPFGREHLYKEKRWFWVLNFFFFKKAPRLFLLFFFLLLLLLRLLFLQRFHLRHFLLHQFVFLLLLKLLLLLRFVRLKF